MKFALSLWWKVGYTLPWLLLVMAGCGGPGQIEQVELPAVRKVVLVTIDTLRADHLTSYGYPVETSPWLDRVVAKGVSFHRAYSQSATTKPAHSSLFTSLYPHDHGVLKNAQKLSERFLTMAEMMASSGFRTGGFVSADAPLSGNVGQGFEYWDVPAWDNRTPGLYRRAEATVDRAIEWVEAIPGEEPLFLWVHLYDPHSPLEPPGPAAERITRSAAKLGQQAHTELLRERGIPISRDRDYQRILKYDGEIRYADNQLERLERALDRAGHNTDALWIVTSDHGQGLGAHDWFGHSVQIYNAQLHVPLVFWFTDGSVPSRQLKNHVVQHVDVLPTLAQIIDGDLSGQILPLRGTSLAPFLRGESAPAHRSIAFSQRSEYANPSEGRLRKRNYEPGSRYALQNLGFKYLYFTEGEDEFYNLDADPYELVNLINAPAYAASRKDFAKAIRVLALSASGREAESVSEEEIKRLRALGYLR